MAADAGSESLARQSWEQRSTTCRWSQRYAPEQQAIGRETAVSQCLSAMTLFGLLLSGCHGLPNRTQTSIEPHASHQQRCHTVPASARPLLPNDSCSEADCVPAAAADYRLATDLRQFPRVVWNDARQIANVDNAIVLALAAAASVGVREAWDGDVREATAADPHRWGDGSRALGHLGEAQYQVPVLVSSWAISVWNDDPHFHDFNEALISAYTLNGLATLAIKGTTNTSRPDSDWNGGQWGFPSFHASSTFTMAAVLEDYYGWKAGLPAYTLAGLISWSRIDERDHDLSDVVFGAVMGYVIGKSVADFHLGGDGHVRLTPWCHPTEGATGVMLETRF